MRAGLCAELAHVGEHDPVGVVAEAACAAASILAAPIATMIGSPAATRVRG